LRGNLAQQWLGRGPLVAPRRAREDTTQRQEPLRRLEAGRAGDGSGGEQRRSLTGDLAEMPRPVAELPACRPAQAGEAAELDPAESLRLLGDLAAALFPADTVRPPRQSPIDRGHLLGPVDLAQGAADLGGVAAGGAARAVAPIHLPFRAVHLSAQAISPPQKHGPSSLGPNLLAGPLALLPLSRGQAAAALWPFLARQLVQAPRRPSLRRRYCCNPPNDEPVPALVVG
jgi:hypothetical protein